MIDAFLELKTADGQPVEGECKDAGFEKAIELRTFSLGDRAAPTPAADDSEKVDTVETEVSKFVTELKQAAEQNLKRQEERHRKEVKGRLAGADVPSPLVQVKSLVTQEVLDKSRERDAKEVHDLLSFKIVKDVDAASADLFQAYCAGVLQPNPKKEYRKFSQFQSAEVTLRKQFEGRQLPFLVCTFTAVTIHGYDLSFDSSRTHMVETITFKFVTYKMRYQAQDGVGGHRGGANPETSGSVGGKVT